MFRSVPLSSGVFHVNTAMVYVIYGFDDSLLTRWQPSQVVSLNQCFTDWLHPHSDTTTLPPPHTHTHTFYAHTRSEPVVGHELLGYEYFHHTRLWWWRRWSLSLKLLLTWPTYATVNPRIFYCIQSMWTLQDTCGKYCHFGNHMFGSFCKTIYNQSNDQNKFQNTNVRYNDKRWMRLYILRVTLLLRVHDENIMQTRYTIYCKITCTVYVPYQKF
jgi:hypothetical protein